MKPTSGSISRRIADVAHRAAQQSRDQDTLDRDRGDADDDRTHRRLAVHEDGEHTEEHALQRRGVDHAHGGDSCPAGGS